MFEDLFTRYFMYKMLHWVLLFLGIGFLVMGFSQARGNFIFKKTAQKALGIVTKIAESRTKDKVILYAPEIRFATENDQVIIFQSTAYRHYSKYKTGDSVEVIYDPTNPSKAYINDSSSAWGVSSFSILAGIGCLIWFFYYLLKK